MSQILTSDVTANVQFAASVPTAPVIPRRGSGRAEELIINYYSARLDRFRRLADPRRDIEAECGHPTDFSAWDYQNLYESNDLAARVVDLFPESSWSVGPSVYEDEDAETQTPFEVAWDALSSQIRGDSRHRQEEGSAVWEWLKRADSLSGIGRYGVILLGLDDGMALRDPAAPRAGQRLLFLRCFPETLAQITRWNVDPTNARYGQPEEYLLSFTNLNQQTSGPSVEPLWSQYVHWSRIIHVADNLSSSETLGRPRMQQVLPRILDVRKILGCSAETFWQNASRDVFFETDPSLGGDVGVDATSIKDEYERMINGLQRAMLLNGFSAKSLAPAIVDPRGSIEVQIDAICVRLDVPKRVFVGSERGELASSQDSRKWHATVRSRRTGYVTPRIIVPFVDRLIMLGVLPEPAEYCVHWPDAETQTQAEKADVALKTTQAFAAYVSGGVEAFVPPQDYLTRVWGWTEEEAEATLTNAEGLLAEMRAEEAAAQEEAKAAMTRVQPNGGTADAGNES